MGDPSGQAAIDSLLQEHQVFPPPESFSRRAAVPSRAPYDALHREVCPFANVLKALGVRACDRVGIYLPMIPDAAIAMLACARIGATHSVVFGGFSADALQDRMIDAEVTVFTSADGGLRR